MMEFTWWEFDSLVISCNVSSNNNSWFSLINSDPTIQCQFMFPLITNQAKAIAPKYLFSEKTLFVFVKERIFFLNENIIHFDLLLH